MGYSVTFNTERRLVTINGKDYSLPQLQAKQKTQIESNILKTAIDLFKSLPQLFDNDDLLEIVESDRFKGDFHSTPLIQ